MPHADMLDHAAARRRILCPAGRECEGGAPAAPVLTGAMSPTPGRRPPVPMLSTHLGMPGPLGDAVCIAIGGQQAD